MTHHEFKTILDPDSIAILLNLSFHFESEGFDNVDFARLKDVIKNSKDPIERKAVLDFFRNCNTPTQRVYLEIIKDIKTDNPNKNKYKTPETMSDKILTGSLSAFALVAMATLINISVALFMAVKG